MLSAVKSPRQLTVICSGNKQVVLQVFMVTTKKTTSNAIIQITLSTRMSNLEVDLLSNTAARCCSVLASIVMQNIKEIHCGISEMNEKKLNFGYVIPC